ncbi:MAG: SLBB domain-containing protein [Ramlibacter sp.]|nr:SLBB domain-containing protein [Ramlibacter sp.]
MVWDFLQLNNGNGSLGMKTPKSTAVLRFFGFLAFSVGLTMGSTGVLAQSSSGGAASAPLSLTPSFALGSGGLLAPERLNQPGTQEVGGEGRLGSKRETVSLPRERDASPPPLGTTEYQRFVQATTGRSLPLFGYNLFATGAFPALQNVPVPSDYVLGPGDEVDLKLWGAVDADLRLAVDRNGQISIPRVGTVNVAGVKASQLEQALRGQISRVYNNFQLSATLGQLRSIQVFVVGQARRPGAYTVSSLSTLISALFESGGPSATGSMRHVQLKRDGKTVTTLDLYKFINEGDKSADARLLPGDVIVLPPAGSRVAVTGALDQPAIFELATAEEALGKLLSYGGRTQALTTPHKVLVERIDAGRAKAPRSVEERALDAKGLQSTVRDGDVVTLFQISPEFSNAVTLRGNVAAPLRYAYQPGMRVSDLIPERDALIVPDYYTRRNLTVQYESGRRVSDGRVADEIKNLLEEINWDYAVVERLDPKEIRSQLIPFNLGKAVRDKDPTANIILQPGDIVTVFGINDLPVPVSKRTQYVRIGGEVQVPGVYQLSPGETLDQLIRRVGGFTANAYAYGTVFTRETTRIQQQKNLDQAIRRMEADINAQAIASVQSARQGEKADTLQANLAAQRNIVSRLQGLRASGRIALELDPRSQSLPHVVLEDGDEITVPTTPSFVGIFGAVTAETSFLHRFNFTARDYLGRAGPTRDADDDNVAVIRADGTVESNYQLTGSGFMGFRENVLDKRLNPGDTIFVPEKFDKRTAYTRFIDGAKDLTTIFYQFGLGAAGLKVLKN